LVLRVLRSEQGERAFSFVAVVEDAGPAAKAEPPESAPVFFVVVDEDGDVGAGAGVLDSTESL